MTCKLLEDTMSRTLRLFILAAVLMSGLLLPSILFAHEHREVGKYEFVVGFLNEPAFEGEQNGISVRITNHETDEPVKGLEETLSAQVIHGAAQRDMPLTPVWNDPGHYKSHFYPTAVGDYTFRFFGEIEGTPIDEQFTSSPGGFDSVQSPGELQFPAQVSTVAELSTQLTAAQRTARMALLLGGAGLVLGLIGVMVAIVALRGRRPGAALHEPAAAHPSR
jgi:hypothetical protein